MLTLQKSTDQLGREVQFLFPLQRIVSTVPSQTEFLFDLGLDDEISGITKFCVHPKNKFKEKIKIGGTKNLNLEKIKSLKPDLIIANKEENEETQIQELMSLYPVWISDVKTLDDAYKMMGKVGEMVGKKEKSAAIISQIKGNFSKRIDKKNIQTPPIELIQTLPKLKINCQSHSAAYLIWQNPYMTVGTDTFINAMLEVAGFKNVIVNKSRYPEINVEELIEMSPQYILLSSEPFPFKQKHIEELQKKVPASKVLLVDGEMFSWYGSRLLKAASYFEQLHELL